MILETTYIDKKQDELINDLVGKPFGIFQAFIMKGVGSKRMIIESVSLNMKNYVNTIEDVTYSNIELRPIGILIRINKGLRSFTWVIPYYQLVIFKTNSTTIHSQGCFIQFKNNTNFKENKSFFNKLLDEKVKYDSQYSFYTAPW